MGPTAIDLHVITIYLLRFIEKYICYKVSPDNIAAISIYSLGYGWKISAHAV